MIVAYRTPYLLILNHEGFEGTRLLLLRLRYVQCHIGPQDRSESGLGEQRRDGDCEIVLVFPFLSIGPVFDATRDKSEGSGGRANCPRYAPRSFWA